MPDYTNLFGTLIINKGGLVIFFLFLLLVNLLGHSGKRGGGWGHIVPRFSYLPGSPISHNTILSSSPVSQPEVGGEEYVLVRENGSVCMEVKGVREGD